MSARQVKTARRRARKVGREFGAAMLQGFVRPCPRWVPGWLWRRLIRLVLQPLPR